MKIATKENRVSFFPLLIFAVAMGFLEAIVVVYVRELYYPEGFNFPLIALPSKIITIELIRELCTLLMLGSVAWLARNVFIRRLSVFLFLFGIWDIFYYVALKLFLDWPDSLLTWDILFLIPITWVGPVLAPVICSILMILMAIFFEHFYSKGKLTSINWRKMTLILIGSFIIIISFTFDFGLQILKGNYLSSIFTINENPDFIKFLNSYIPTRFHWELFFAGITFILLGNALILKDVLQKSTSVTNN